MNDTTNQAVVEDADAAAQPAVDANNAQEPTLEQLLDEYDRSVQRPQAQPEPVQQHLPQDQQPYIPPEIRQLQNKLVMDDVRKSAQNIFGDRKLPERAMIGYLEQMAREIPQITAAFVNRHNDPRMLQKWERYLAKQVDADFPQTQIDPVATEDREAVAQAVRGASTKVTAEPPPKFGGMSNAEYRKAIRDQYGFDPGV